MSEVLPPAGVPQPTPITPAAPQTVAPAATTAPVVAPVAAAAPAAVPVEALPPETPLISMDDFARVQLRTAEILEARPHPKADRLMILRVKVGEQQKQIVAGIRLFYTPEQLIGKTIVVVNNLQPAKLRGEESFGMLLAVRLPEGTLRLLTTDGPAPSGLQVS